MILETEAPICCSNYFTHSLVDSCMCLYWGSNLQPHYQADALKQLSHLARALFCDLSAVIFLEFGYCIIGHFLIDLYMLRKPALCDYNYFFQVICLLILFMVFYILSHRNSYIWIYHSFLLWLLDVGLYCLQLIK